MKIDSIYLTNVDVKMLTGVENIGSMHNILHRLRIQPVKVGGRWMYYRRDIEDLLAKPNAQELLTPRRWVQKVVGNHIEIREVA